MKRIFFTVAFAATMIFAGANAVLAQDESYAMLDGSLYDVVFSWKHKKPLAKESHWAGLSFAFSDLKGLPKDVELRLERSYSISWNVDDWEIPIHRHWLLASGFGFDWSRWHFGSDAFLRNTDGVTNFDYYESGLKDSKLLVYYGKIPLLLEYQTRVHSNTFFIQGGVEGLVKLYSKSRIEIGNGKKTDKEDFRNLKVYPVNARLFLHIGFNSLGVFGYYQPFSMFQHNRGPELQNFGFGITLN
ncbi:MAG: hypothetical protein LBR84_00950 [Tannerella sp.]|jgi:hypothetical protein|nr:hypothetical protein [Tannerella sp.]